MWVLWIFIGMACGWLTIGLLIPFLKELSANLAKKWADAITRPKPTETKTGKVAEPRTVGGKIGFENDEEFQQWRKSNNIKTEAQ